MMRANVQVTHPRGVAGDDCFETTIALDNGCTVTVDRGVVTAHDDDGRLLYRENLRTYNSVAFAMKAAMERVS